MERGGREEPGGARVERGVQMGEGLEGLEGLEGGQREKGEHLVVVLWEEQGQEEVGVGRKVVVEQVETRMAVA